MPEPRPDTPYRCEDDAREALAAASLARSVVPASGVGPAGGPGMLSLRWRRSGAAGFLVTSRSTSSSASQPAAIEWTTLVHLPSDDGDAAGEPPEWRLHRDLYRERTDVGAVIRWRSVFATALACLEEIQRHGIPAFHADVWCAGGDSIRCAADAPIGSPALSENVLAALEDRAACLLAGLGLLVAGPNLPATAALAAEVESLAQIYCQVLQLRGTAAAADRAAAAGPAAPNPTAGKNQR
jgi:L-fuculose-phosphate aldolase